MLDSDVFVITNSAGILYTMLIISELNFYFFYYIVVTNHSFDVSKEMKTERILLRRRFYFMKDTADDLRLVKKVLGGEVEYFSDLITKYEEKVYKTCFKSYRLHYQQYE